MKKSKAACSGCYNNDYNFGLGGAKECWSYESATIVKKIEIHVDQPPPYKQKPRPVMSCYSKQRYWQVDPGSLDERGFWKRGFFG